MKLPTVFLVLALLLGAGYAVLLPPLQVPDEWGHFFRAYTVSEGSCLAHPELGVPDRIRTLPEIYPARVEIVRRITAGELIGFVRASPKEGPRIPSLHIAVDLYSCVPYLPAAVTIGAGRHLNLSGLALLYIGRLTNLIVYACIVYLALRIMPDLRLLLFSVALLPMTLQQAASLSADSLTLATSFLLIAYILRLAFGPEPRVTLRDQCILAGIVVVFSLCKFNIWLVLLPLLIPKSKFGGVRAKSIAVAVQVVASCIWVILWHSVNKANVQAYDAFRSSGGVHLASNLRFVYQEPLIFIEALGRTLVEWGPGYLRELVGDLGWLCVPLPYWLVWCTIALLFAIALTQGRIMLMRPSQRAVLAAIVTCGVLSLFVLLFTLEELDGYLGVIRSGKGYLPGLQGRYLIPFTVPFFLLFTNSKLRTGFRSIALLTVAWVLVSSGVAFEMVARTYFDSSRPQFAASEAWRRYEGWLVKRPGLTPEDDKVYFVKDGTKHWVTDYRWLVNHGYKWPEDITVITREELDAIPVGKAIQ